MTTQIYGYAFHSPLVLMNLVPLKYAPLYLDAAWSVSDVKKNVEPALTRLGQQKTLVIFAGSLRVLKMFVREYSEISVKVVLFDFPGLIHPFLDPLIEWIDCDHQTGGAWQITKTKLNNFENLLNKLNFLDNDGRDLIERMERFVPKDKTNDIEKFAEYMPSNYKDLLDQTENNSDSLKDIVWKKKTLSELVTLFLAQVPKHKRVQLLYLVLDYQLGKVTKRDYNSKIKFFIDNNANAKKLSTATRKWMDDSKHGKVLFNAYLDYVCNITRRSWKTILEDHGAVAELDLLILVAQQHRDNVDLTAVYLEESKSILELPSNMNLPEAKVKWSDGSMHYHPESPALLSMFELV